MMTFDALRGDWDRRRLLVLALVLTGAALRVWQYAANGSLWLDEAALARNIIDRAPAGLWRPLDFGQVAPVGFLLVEKAIVLVAGVSEYALRAFPLLCGLASLPLFVVVARRALHVDAVPYAVGLFALGQPLIYFSSQVKQYAPDVVASLLGVWLAFRLMEASWAPRSIARVGAFGALIPWMSQPGALVLAGAATGAAAAMLRTRASRSFRAALPVLGIWAASIAAAAWLALSNVPQVTRDYLSWFWRRGYMPYLPWEQARWSWETMTSLFSSFGAEAFRTNGGLAYAWPELFVVVTCLGLVQIGRASRDTLMVLVGAIGAALAASLLRLYPLSGRLLVFLIPVLLLATAAGAHVLWAWSASRARLAGLVVATVLVAIPLHAAIKLRPPYLIQPLRPVLEQVEHLRLPGDAVYVDYAAAQAFLYYAPRFGFESDAVVIGKCAVSDRRDYLRQVDGFRGRRRVWIIGTHLSAVERSLTVGYLERIGHRIQSVFVPPTGAPLRFAAYARLYDLSDPRRLASSSAATHPIQEVPLPTGVGVWGCAGPLAPVD